MAGVLLLLGCRSTGTEGNWSPLRRTGCGLICIWLWEFAGAGYDRFGLRFVFFPLPSSPHSLSLPPPGVQIHMGWAFMGRPRLSFRDAPGG